MSATSQAETRPLHIVTHSGGFHADDVLAVAPGAAAGLAVIDATREVAQVADDWLRATAADEAARQRLLLELPQVALPVRFTRLDSGTAHDGELRNLSLSGCCIAGRELPREGAQVAVHLPQELLAAQDPSWPPLGGPTEDLTLAGRVRWTERPDDGMMGVEFLRMESRLEPLIDALRTSVVPR